MEVVKTSGNLIKSDSCFKIKVSEKLEKDIRELCRIYPGTEWSGVLFYNYTGGFEKGNLEINAEDFLLMDIGQTTTTAFNITPDVLGYMVDKELLDYQIGLIHSHHSMAKLNC